MDYDQLIINENLTFKYIIHSYGLKDIQISPYICSMFFVHV